MPNSRTSHRSIPACFKFCRNFLTSISTKQMICIYNTKYSPHILYLKVYSVYTKLTVTVHTSFPHIIELSLLLTLRILAVSSISVMNVDVPFSCESSAPIRANIESTTLMLAYEAGTKLPICAIKTTMPTCKHSHIYSELYKTNKYNV